MDKKRYPAAHLDYLGLSSHCQLGESGGHEPWLRGEKAIISAVINADWRVNCSIPDQEY